MNFLVIIAHSFPPNGDAGVHRPLRFIRNLPTDEWSVTVISANLPPGCRYDEGLMKLVPSDTEVLRVQNPDWWQAIQSKRALRIQKNLSNRPRHQKIRVHTTNQFGIRSFIRDRIRTLEACLYQPDMAMCWIRPAVKATVNVCERKRPRAILATGGPWSSFLVAQKASKRTGVPYVLDFRDAWTLVHGEDEARRPAWAVHRDRRTLYGLLKHAQAVIFRYNSEAECYWRAYSGALDTARIHIIPNGFDGTIRSFPTAKYSDKCTILYAGTVAPYRYDTLLQSIRLLKESCPDQAEQLRVVFVGEGTYRLANEAAALGLSDTVKTMDPVSYAEATRLEQNADILLLLGVKPCKGHEFGGSKVFTYLKAGRPIFGVLPPSEMKNILQTVGVSTIADVDSVFEIAATLRKLLDAWATGSLSRFVPDSDACRAYSAERQTKDLIRVIEGLPANNAFVPGSVDIPASLAKDIGHAGWTSDIARA